MQVKSWGWRQVGFVQMFVDKTAVDVTALQAIVRMAAEKVKKHPACKGSWARCRQPMTEHVVLYEPTDT